jgi:PAT family beta-lactamase induction signal transducer AmpG
LSPGRDPGGPHGRKLSRAVAIDDAGRAMSARSKRTLLWTSTTYFGEGLPWSFLHQMGTEFLTAIGASKTQISSTSLFHLAVTFKFLWSPFVDLVGRKRSWVVATQLVLGGGMLAVAAAASGWATHGLWLFWVVASVLAVVHATHDIACDGFYLQALARPDQALFSGVRTAAFRIAMIVGSSALVYLAGRTSWLLGFGAAGIIMLAVALLNAAVMPRLDAGAADLGASRPVPPAPGAAFLVAYKSFFAQPQATLVLSFMLFYKLGDIMMFAMSKPLLRDIGIDTAQRGILNGIGTVSFIAGSIAGGGLIARFGLGRALIPMTFLQNLAIPLYIGLAVWRPHFAGVVPIVLTEQLVAGVGSAAHIVFLMQRCRSVFSASHYALATAVVSLGSTFSGYLSGPINEAVGHPWFFTIAFVASWPSLLLVLRVPRTPLEAEA